MKGSRRGYTSPNPAQQFKQTKNPPIIIEKSTNSFIKSIHLLLDTYISYNHPNLHDNLSKLKSANYHWKIHIFIQEKYPFSHLFTRIQTWKQFKLT